jgi:intracellular sulfur oxidation DsrE/DsrF family protein
MKSTALLAGMGLLAALLVADPTGSPKYQHPLIADHGGMVVVPEAAEQPQKDAKVILDITSDEMTGGVFKGFDRAALISNQYAQAGVGPKQGMKMVIILHGPATKAALTDDAYQKHSSSYARQGGLEGNPNLALIRRLDEVGVEVYVCAQALAHRGFAMNEVASPVKVAVSAATVNINKQMENYAFLPFQ